MSIDRFCDRLQSLGCEAKVEGHTIAAEIDGIETLISFDDDWIKTLLAYYRARQYRFDQERRILFANRAAEYLAVRLDPGFTSRVDHRFVDSKGNRVELGIATREFQLSFFESERYENSFDRIKERLVRRSRSREENINRRDHRVLRLRPDDVLFRYYTIKYIAKRKPRSQSIESRAIRAVKACLFSLAYKRDESWELSHEIKAKGLIYPSFAEDGEEDLEIPRSTYDDSAVTYYKVAKSSQFPSQVFLSYYHVLEYHFLRVADEDLYNAVCEHINDPDFRGTYDNVSRLLAVIKRNDKTPDEHKMLIGVLRKYVSEEEFIEFVKSYEQNVQNKIFTQNKIKLFGKSFVIKLEKGHALANSAAILKHIRNALVHSSDRYSREETFLPLSASEDIVASYIPVIRYLAERVIFATANAS